jgi:hypothetical protein
MSDHAADVDKHRSTGGYVFLLGGGAIHSGSKLMPTVATSTLEAKYMAHAWGAIEALWLRRVIATPESMDEVKSIEIKCGNQGALGLMHKHVGHQLAKQIDVVHHFLRELVARSR